MLTSHRILLVTVFISHIKEIQTWEEGPNIKNRGANFNNHNISEGFYKGWSAGAERDFKICS